MARARPLVVGIADLVRNPGIRRQVQREVVLDGLRISAAWAPVDAAVVLDLALEAIPNAVVATGTITVPWVGECRRCLNEVHGETSAEVREIFERHPTEGETYPLETDQVDLEPMVRDAALLALPIAPLCAHDCQGPAPDTFPATVEDGDPADGLDALDGSGGPGEPKDTRARASGSGPSEPSPIGDPRWSALDQLKFD